MISSCGATREVRAALLQQIQQAGVGDEAALDHLGEAGDPLARGQRFQEADVGDDRARLVERAHQVLARAEIDAGLAADRRVDHRQQRRRHQRERHAAQVDRRHEAGVVGRGAAADADDRGAPVVAAGGEPLARFLDLRQVLARLARPQLQPLDVRQPRAQRRDQLARPRRTLRDLRVDQHRDAGRLRIQRRRQLVRDRVRRKRADADVVAAVAQRDAERFHSSLEHLLSAGLRSSAPLRQICSIVAMSRRRGLRCRSSRAPARRTAAARRAAARAAATGSAAPSSSGRPDALPARCDRLLGRHRQPEHPPRRQHRARGSPPGRARRRRSRPPSSAAGPPRAAPPSRASGTPPPPRPRRCRRPSCPAPSSISLVQVDERPVQALGQQPPDGRLARRHEPDQEDRRVIVGGRHGPNPTESQGILPGSYRNDVVFLPPARFGFLLVS